MSLKKFTFCSKLKQKGKNCNTVNSKLLCCANIQEKPTVFV